MRWRWVVAGVLVLGSLGAAFLALRTRSELSPLRDAAIVDASEDEAAAPLAEEEGGDPFASGTDAAAEIELPGWPGWPLPRGTTLTPETFCEGAAAARLFVRDPRCSIAETKADLVRKKKIPFAEFGEVMARSHAKRCIVRLGASVAKRRVQLDPEAGERCVATGIELAFDVGPSPIDTSACNGYVIGLAQRGEACSEPWECVDGLACVGFTAKKDGRCKPLPPLGAPCGNGEPDKNLPFDIGDRPACAKGAVCDPWGGTCRRAHVRGERCEQDWDCDVDLACRAHVCAGKARVGAGGACIGVAECEPSLYCAGTDYTKHPGVCTEKKRAGESCRDDSECKGHCDAQVCMSWCQSG
ncbi:MAG TPA: hypothetical protein VIF62_38270 [Labilithrix sp.]